MPDDTQKRGPADRIRVNVHEEWEVRWWCKKWNVTREQLEAAVAKVGVMVKDVQRQLGK